MKIEDVKKIAPISEDALHPLKELSKEDKESIYYCDLADSQLNSIWY